MTDRNKSFDDILLKVNVREEGMLGQVLPQLQTFIEENCTGETGDRTRGRIIL